MVSPLVRFLPGVCVLGGREGGVDTTNAEESGNLTSEEEWGRQGRRDSVLGRGTFSGELFFVSKTRAVYIKAVGE
jgi:hypothetical protein